MLYFFHVPGNADIHNKNVTVTVANNGTELEKAASVVNKADEDHLEEEADKSDIQKKSAPDTGGTEDDNTPVEVKTEKALDQAPEIQNVDPPKKEDSAEAEEV